MCPHKSTKDKTNKGRLDLVRHTNSPVLIGERLQTFSLYMVVEVKRAILLQYCPSFLHKKPICLQRLCISNTEIQSLFLFT